MSMIDDIFEPFVQGNPSGSSYNFTSETDMDNIESMRHFIEENNLEDYVTEDDGTLVYLEHPDHEFYVALNSYGLGDFYTHGIETSQVSKESLQP